MIEAYKIGVSMVLNTGALDAGFKTIMDAFGRIQKAQRDTQAGFNEFASGVRATASSVNRLADAMERVARAAGKAGKAASGFGNFGGAGGSGGYGPRSPGGALVPSPLMLTYDPASRGIVSAPRMLGYDGGAGAPASGGGGGGLGLNFGGAMAFALNANIAVNVVEQLVGGIGRLIDKAKGLNDAVVVLEQRGVSAFQAASLEDQAFEIARLTPGRNVTSILRDAGSLRGILGQSDGQTDTLASVKQILPQVETTAAAISSVMPGMDSDASMHLLMRAIELRGGLIDEKTHKISPEKFSEELEAIYKVLVTGGGMISPNDLVNVMQQAGPMARMMDADGFYKMMIATILDMKGNRAGTALTAAGRFLFGGVIPKRNADELESLGLIPQGGYTHNGSGSIQLTEESRTMLDREMKGGLFAFVQNYLRPALEAKGYTSPEAQNRELYRVGSTETFRRILALFLQNSDQVMRDAKLLDSTPGASEALKLAGDKSIGFNMSAMFASLSNFLQSVEKANSGTIISTLQAATALFNFLGKNEEASARISSDAGSKMSGPDAFYHYAPWEKGFWLRTAPTAGAVPGTGGAGSSASTPLYTHEVNATPERVGASAASGTVRGITGALAGPPATGTGGGIRVGAYGNTYP